MSKRTPVVIAVDQDDNTNEIVRFVRECGGKPYLRSSFHDAFETLIKLSGNTCLVVSFQLEGERNMGSRLLNRLKDEGLDTIPTFVLNKNIAADNEIRMLCFSYTFVQDVINEEKRSLWSVSERVRRIFDNPSGAIFEGNYEMPSDDAAENRGRVFVVHRDKHPQLKRLLTILQRMSVDPIMLPGEATLGKTIIEAIEDFSQVDFAIVLLTADDHCAHQPDGEMRPRARQNVIFEAGYLMGKLGRNRVAMLIEDGLEHPSDLSGIIYIPQSLDNDKLLITLHNSFDTLNISHSIKTW